MYPIRTQIQDMVVEFLPPATRDRGALIVYADGMPSVPSKSRVLRYWSKRGYWVAHPRYRGTWESGGSFLSHDPTDDIIDTIHAFCNDTLISAYDGTEYAPCITRSIVIGSSFGGAVALLASLHDTVDRVVALSPVIDWSREIDSPIEPLAHMCTFLRRGFGEAYRFLDTDWEKLGHDVQFFNPIHHISSYDPHKLFIMHAKDDMIVSYEAVCAFLESVSCRHRILRRGGHLSSTVSIKPVLGMQIRRFITS